MQILVVADADAAFAWLADALAMGVSESSPVHAMDEASVRSLMAERSWDAVVCVFDGPRAPHAMNALKERVDGADPALVIVADAFEDAAEASQRLGAAVCLRRFGFSHLGPALARAEKGRERRTERASSLAFEEGQRTVLEHVAAGKPLTELLEEIVLLIERQSNDAMFCSILLLDRKSQRVRHGAAPHLPRELVEGVDGTKIGPHEGSCGAAAYLGEPIVIEDIGTHPNWKNYRHLVLPSGLRSCWSSPILTAPGGEVLGTFAMYYREARAPTAVERRWVARATHLAAVAISRDRIERAFRQVDARYRQIVETAYEGVWLIDADAHTLFVNQRTAEMLGYDLGELLGRRIVDFMDEASRIAAEGRFLERLRTVNEQQEFRFRRKDGTYVWALVSGSPIRNDEGSTVGALAMITDIEELKRTEEALRRSEAEFRVVFEHAAVGMALLTDLGVIARSNPSLQEFLGYTGPELQRLTLVDVMHPDDREGSQELYRSLMSYERDSHCSERRFVRRNRDVVWGRITASLVRTSRTAPRSVIVLVENVTERRQLEEAVRASEGLRTLMYSAVTDVLFYLGVEANHTYRFLSVNPAFIRTTGLSEADVVGKTVAEVIPQPSLDLVLGHYDRATRERRTITWDEVTAYPAGKKYGEVSISPIFDAQCTCTNLVGTVRDVTERRIAEERIAAQAALLDKAKDAIFVRTIDGDITYWNKGAERLYGWASEEVVGRNVRDLLYEESAAFEAAQRGLVENREWSGELLHHTRTGRRITIEGSWTLIGGEQEAPAVFAINTDITEKKRLEAQLFRGQRLESLGVLAAGIAHDFNNVLTAILGNVAMAQLELHRDHPAGLALSEIEKATKRGADLVRQLLTFGRRQEPRHQRTTLALPVEEALGLLRASVPRKIRIESRFAPDAPDVLADPTQIHQIVMNLGTNAAHAIGDREGTLAVHVERLVLDRDLNVRTTTLHRGTYARLLVTDTGTGMDEAMLDHVFDPFFTTKGPGMGSGLGLSVVHGIVANHHGAIAVASRPGRGTEFSLYFPAAPPAEEHR